METGGWRVTACACTPAPDLCLTRLGRDAEVQGCLVSFGILRQQSITAALLTVSCLRSRMARGSGAGLLPGPDGMSPKRGAETLRRLGDFSLTCLIFSNILTLQFPVPGSEAKRPLQPGSPCSQAPGCEPAID